MRAAKVSVVLAACVLFVATPAVAEGDPYRSDNFERKGFMLGVALGTTLQTGFGDLSNLRGLGGAGAIRIGTTASERLLFLVQVDTGVFLIERQLTEEVVANVFNSITLGGQYYLRELWWLRAGLGVANFEKRNDTRGGTTIAGSNRSGLAVVFSTGADFLRRRRFVLNVEWNLATGIYRDAALTQSSILLGATLY